MVYKWNRQWKIYFPMFVKLWTLSLFPVFVNFDLLEIIIFIPNDTSWLSRIDEQICFAQHTGKLHCPEIWQQRCLPCFVNERILIACRIQHCFLLLWEMNELLSDSKSCNITKENICKSGRVKLPLLWGENSSGRLVLTKNLCLSPEFALVHCKKERTVETAPLHFYLQISLDKMLCRWWGNRAMLRKKALKQGLNFCRLLSEPNCILRSIAATNRCHDALAWRRFPRQTKW